MSNPDPIFAFEADFAGSLHCIPMSVRLKLDNAGVKVSLKQWNRLGREQRDELLRLPCEGAESRERYRDYIVRAIESRTGDPARNLPVAEHPEWTDERQIPPQVSDYFTAQGLPALTVAQWAALPPLQRYVLIKLTRPGHRNENFLPALREFGLLSR
jgi:hypothetical protein